MSLPIQSVPNRCSREGAWFIAWKLVVMSVELIKRLEITTAIRMNTVIPMVSRVLVLKFILPMEL